VLNWSGAASLDEGGTVQRDTLVNDDVGKAIDAAVRTFGIAMIACATHGRWVLHRSVRGSDAWSVLAYFFLGAVADGLVHHLRCPVISVPVTTAKSIRAGRTKGAPC
jgi:nucleotide-binding universal stress UspA family protein